jgi:hypothetical protein
LGDHAPYQNHFLAAIFFPAALHAETGWIDLFNGANSDGWHSPKSQAFPAQSWKIENHELHVVASYKAESQSGGDIISEKRLITCCGSKQLTELVCLKGIFFRLRKL